MEHQIRKRLTCVAANALGFGTSSPDNGVSADLDKKLSQIILREVVNPSNEPVAQVQL